MKEKNFAHLHVHTEYSLLDGAARVKDLIEQTKNLGMDSVAITDHGTMFGIIDFYKNAVEIGVKPIIGCEFYLAQKSHLDHEIVDGIKNFHLVLLAENNEGYKNLVKLASLAATEGFYYRPRIDKELLRKYHDGLIALSACTAGEIPKNILRDNFSRAVELTKEYAEIFGKENFFLELQNHGLEEEKKVRDALIKISRELNIGLVATNDVHYVWREDSEFHDILLCIQTNKIASDKKRLRFSSDDYFLKSPEEMRFLFAETPDACENTLKIAERCNVTLEFGKLQLPAFPIPAQYADEKNYLRELCREKISERYKIVTNEIQSRLDYELGVIDKMGYDGYFLIVWDFINYAKKNKIPVGPGRGSAAGSIVAYILGITDLDPLKYNLLFERFLNPERVTMPDIDVDFCYIRREEVIEYVKKFYGEDRVAQIVTFGTLAAKAAIRDVVRVLDIPYSEGSRIIKMIPAELKITLEKALQTSPELKSEYNANPQVRRIIDLAKKLEGLPRHSSVHAAGIVISKNPLTDFVPVMLSGNMLVTQYDKDKIEELGLLKMDFLGLRTLTIIDETLANIRKSRGEKTDLAKIPLQDELTGKMISAGKTGAVFQMESAGMITMIRELKPQSFEDLIPTVALYRPGPLGSGMVEDFINGKHGEKKVEYLHPKLEPILKETFGVILYQEQVMQIVQKLAGFSLGQADLMRRAMGKKKPKIIMEQKENFLNGCLANGLEKNLAEKIFELLLHFADYGFNKSHSAAYALIAWQTAYLKAHYPAEFMSAMLSAVMDSDKVFSYVELSRKMGIKVLPPDINLSSSHFFVENGAIRFGLSAIKNLGEPAVDGVIKVRESEGKFKSLIDFCRRVDLKNFTAKAMENLVKCGAFDSIDTRRTALLESLKDSVAEGFQKRKDDSRGQIGLFGETEIHETAKVLPNVKERPKNEILSWEKETLGFYFSGHPLDEFAEKFSDLIKVSDIKNNKIKDGRRVKVGGMVSEVKRLTTKRGESMAFLMLEDFSDNMKITVFPNVFYRVSNLLVPNEAIVVSGKAENLNDSWQILADAVTNAKNYTSEIYLKILPEKEKPETFEKLREIFANHSGKSFVYLNRRDKWQKLGNDYKISADKKTRSELENLLGGENVKFY